MSKMAELAMEIEDMLMDGRHPTVIAQVLEVPLSMVYDMLESMGQETVEELSPFETVNS
jgi:transposase-like protein